MTSAMAVLVSKCQVIRRRIIYLLVGVPGGT